MGQEAVTTLAALADKLLVERYAPPSVIINGRGDESPSTVEQRYIYALGNGQWNSAALRELLEDVLPHNGVFQDFEIVHDFPHIGRKVMLLNARRLDRSAGLPGLILLAMEDATASRSGGTP